MIDTQFEELVRRCKNQGCGQPTRTNLNGGGVLIEIPDVRVEGWNRPLVNVLFVAPPGFPASQPECFWVQPAGFRLANGGTPQNSSDGSTIPGDIEEERSTTWFSWHVVRWDRSHDTLFRYFRVILNRLDPAR